MSFQAQQFDRLVQSDPALSHFPIRLLEDGSNRRWHLEGVVPSPGIKKRAGTLARGLAPPEVWLVNDIKVQPGDGASPVRVVA